MNKTSSSKNILYWLIRFILIVGPGLFCVGYTIGTGSVTSMIVAGSKYGTEFLWVVALSCLFSGILMEAYGRFALVSGQTALNSFKKELPCGRLFALVTMLMVIAGQWCCLSGLVGLSSNAIFETLQLYIPDMKNMVGDTSYYWGIGIAVLILGSLYTLFWFGNYSRIESVLVVLVTVLGLSFVISLFLVAPTFKQICNGMIPSIPKEPNVSMLIAAMVGTTLAAPTFVVRPMLVLSKGWTKADLKTEQRDSMVSALVMFIISGSIMCCSAGAIFNRHGQPIEHVLDMVETLRPIAGDFASILFIVGLVSAGLSSILPIAMIAGYLLGDFRNGKIEITAPLFRILTATACLIGLTVPIMGTNPVAAQIMTQIAQVFVLPLVIGGIFVLVNKDSIMGKHRAGIFLNLGMIASFCFALMISWKAILGLMAMFSK